MSTSSVTNPLTTLTGSSTFASDLQNAVSRAVAIASLPIGLLQADENQVSSKSGELAQLGSLFGGVVSSLQSLSDGTGSGALSVSESDSSVVKASLSGSALPGTYTINVLNAGASASAISSAPTPQITDPSSQNLGQGGPYTLTIGSQTFQINPSSANLNALASAINSSGAPAQAVVVNLGGPSAPDYRLVVQSTTFANIAVQLTDQLNTTLLNPLTTGANASYTVNGQPPGGISTSSATVTVAPGLNVTLEKAGPATVTVSSSLNTVSNALSSFVNTYNQAVAELTKNRGQNGGALSGDNIVLSMQQALNQLVNYSGGSGSITSLTQLGVEFTQQGTLTFDPTALANLSPGQATDALSFLGNPTSGGFLQFATNTLNSITDSSSGLISSETQALQNRLQRDQQQVLHDRARVNRLQADLQAQMARADALIATLQSKNTFLQGLFQFGTSNNPNVASAG
jgi:flagellar hook-associated protein 2